MSDGIPAEVREQAVLALWRAIIANGDDSLRAAHVGLPAVLAVLAEEGLLRTPGTAEVPPLQRKHLVAMAAALDVVLLRGRSHMLHPEVADEALRWVRDRIGNLDPLPEDGRAIGEGRR